MIQFYMFLFMCIDKYKNDSDILQNVHTLIASGIILYA